MSYPTDCPIRLCFTLPGEEVLVNGQWVMSQNKVFNAVGNMTIDFPDSSSGGSTVYVTNLYGIETNILSMKNDLYTFRVTQEGQVNRVVDALSLLQTTLTGVLNELKLLNTR